MREKVAEMEKDIAYLIDKHFLPRINYPTIDITKTVSKTIVEHTLALFDGWQVEVDEKECPQSYYDGINHEGCSVCKGRENIYNRIPLAQFIAEKRESGRIVRKEEV
jgi:hypothetical protein